MIFISTLKYCCPFLVSFVTCSKLAYFHALHLRGRLAVQCHVSAKCDQCWLGMALQNPYSHLWGLFCQREQIFGKQRCIVSVGVGILAFHLPRNFFTVHGSHGDVIKVEHNTL